MKTEKTAEIDMTLQKGMYALKLKAAKGSNSVVDTTLVITGRDAGIHLKPTIAELKSLNDQLTEMIEFLKEE
jgi:hypothetical protein